MAKQPQGKVPLQELELRRKTLGERLQRYHALSHMCNQSNRRDVTGGWRNDQKAVSVFLLFSKSLCVCQSQSMFCESYLLLFVKLQVQQHIKLQYV